MLTAYRDTGGEIHKAGSDALPADIIWIDLLDPTPEERERVEARVKIRLPSKEALSEIEASSRLVVDHGVLYLSTPVVARGAGEEIDLSPAGFILSKRLLVTIRYTPLPTFDAVARQMEAEDGLTDGVAVFTALMEAIIDRGADILEHLGAAIDKISRSVFQGGLSDLKGRGNSTGSLRQTLGKLGSMDDRLSKARDVLLGIGRIASFAADIGHEWISPEFRSRLEAVCKDVSSLSDYETHLSDKIQFLLDAILGYITIEQNDIFKVLTIASVVGVPPTLLAGIWGMNFKNIPELNWDLGYPMAWAAIILSGLLPLVWFRKKGWF